MTESGSISPKHKLVLRHWLNANTVGAVLLLATIAWSMSQVLRVERERNDPNKIILRLAHWGLEANYRESTQDVIDAYEKLHPDIHIIQVPISERAYNQWLYANLISGTGPDLAEALTGGVAAITDKGQDQYVARYFIPLTDYVNEPNPYNAGTDLEHVKWRDTFADGMRGGYREYLQEYYAPPTTISTSRLCYNKVLLKQVTGLDRPPQTLGAFLEMCAQIREYGRAADREIIPIAGGLNDIGAVTQRYAIAFTSSYEEKLDTDLDGEIKAHELAAGFARKDISFDDPPIKAYFECIRAITANYPPGFLSLGREQALSLFARGRAVMIFGGSWQIGSLLHQSEFPIGVFEYPLPGPGERWSEFVSGRHNEAAFQGSGTYAVYRYSKHANEAIDFLLYLSSREGNEMFTWKTGFPPAVIGSAMPDYIEPYRVDPVGFTTYANLGFHSETATSGSRIGVVYQGQLWRLLQGEIDYDQFTAEMTKAIQQPTYGTDEVWGQAYEQATRISRDLERSLAHRSMPMLLEPTSVTTRTKYRRVLLQQVQLNNGEEHRHRFEQIYQRQIRGF